MRHAFDDKFGMTANVRSDEHALDGDGVMTRMCGRAVFLASLDPRGRIAAGGSSPSRTRFVAWYLLASGEAWTLSGRGEVTIR